MLSLRPLVPSEPSAAVVAGAMCGLAYTFVPFVPLELLLWGWMVPLLLSLRGETGFWRFYRRGAFTMFVALVVACWWIALPSVRVGLVGIGLGAVFMSVPWAALWALRALVGWRVALWCFPLVWMAWEAATLATPLGPAGNLLANAQGRLTWLVQMADVGGAWLVTGWVVLVNVALTRTVERWQAREAAARLTADGGRRTTDDGPEAADDGRHTTDAPRALNPTPSLEGGGPQGRWVGGARWASDAPSSPHTPTPLRGPPHQGGGFRLAKQPLADEPRTAGEGAHPAIDGSHLTIDAPQTATEGPRPAVDGSQTPFEASHPPFEAPHPAFDGSRTPFEAPRTPFEAPQTPFGGPRSAVDEPRTGIGGPGPAPHTPPLQLVPRAAPPPPSVAERSRAAAGRALSPPRRRLAVGLARTLALALAPPLAYAAVRMATLPPDAATIRVASVQPNLIPSEVATRGDFEAASLATLALAASAVDVPEAQRPDLIVLPEAAFLGDLRRDAAARLDLSLLVARSGVPILSGMVARPWVAPADRSAMLRADRRAHLQQNAAVLVTPALARRRWTPADTLVGAGADPAVYAKRRLIPFVEGMPYADRGSFLARFGLALSPLGLYDAREGRAAPLAFPDRRGRTWRVGVLICYEQFYGADAADAVRQGAAFLAAPTNESWFARTSGSRLISVAARLRAIETRRTLVRATSTGLTGAVDARGRPYGEVPTWTALTTTADVALRTDQTLFVRAPYAVPLASAAGLAAVVLVGIGGQIRARRGLPS